MTEKLLNRHRICPAFLAELANGSFWVEGWRWCLCLLRYSKQREQNCFPTHVISIYLTSQKFWKRETQIFWSNIWTKKMCTLKFKALLIFPVCSPYRKYVNVSCLSPACFLIQVQICRKTLNIFIQIFSLETFFNKSLPACKIPCPVPLPYPVWKYLLWIFSSCWYLGRS